MWSHIKLQLHWRRPEQERLLQIEELPKADYKESDNEGIRGD